MVSRAGGFSFGLNQNRAPLYITDTGLEILDTKLENQIFFTPAKQSNGKERCFGTENLTFTRKEQGQICKRKQLSFVNFSLPDYFCSVPVQIRLLLYHLILGPYKV